MAVYRQDGCQRKEFAATFREAREIKIRRTAEEAGRRAGTTLHAYALDWVDHYAGRGANDAINDRTRREYRRLLITYALSYFDPGERLRDIDEQRVRAFVDWLCRLTDADGHRLCDRSVHNAVLPLQSCLRHAARAGLLGDGGSEVFEINLLALCRTVCVPPERRYPSDLTDRQWELIEPLLPEPPAGPAGRPPSTASGRSSTRSCT